MSRQKLTRFNPTWLKLPEYSNWLIPVDDSNSAGCKQCNSTFSLSNMGKRAVNSYMDYVHLAGRGFNKEKYICILLTN